MIFSRSLIAFSFVAAMGLMSAAPRSYAVTVIHSNDVLGEIEPCGCRTNPLGGYARKANFLKNLKDHELIQVDAGDLLFATDVIPDFLKNQSEFQARYVLKILDQLHHDAVVPGEKDFALGTKEFLSLISKSHVHFIAANLLKKNGSPLLAPSVVLKRKDTRGKTVRVAILGLVGKDLDWPKDLKVSDPIKAASQRVPELRKQADYVIALTHQGLDADKKLAEKVKGIDFIIGGHTQSFLQNPLVVKANGHSTTILQSSFRNQYVGKLDLETYARTPNSQNSDDSYQLVGLDPNFDSPAGQPSETDQLVSEFKTKLAEMNVHDDEVMQTSHAPARAAGKYQTFPRCAECHLKQFDFWRKTPHMNALHALVEAKQDKNKECLTCHTVGLGDPQGVNNINQLAQLRPVEASPTPDKPADDSVKPTPVFAPNEVFARFLSSVSDAKTIHDQVPSLLKKDSSVSVHDSLAQIQNAWTPVQCENCHGAGGDHPFSGTIKKKVENTTCLACHNPTRAPDWYNADGTPNEEKIRAKHAQIACPAGDMTL